MSSPHPKLQGASSISRSFEPRAFHGWALRAACRLDAAHPSLLAHVVQSSPLKRQAIFAACAEIDWDCPQVLAERLQGIDLAGGGYASYPLARIARTLRTARASQIV